MKIRTDQLPPFDIWLRIGMIEVVNAIDEFHKSYTWRIVRIRCKHRCVRRWVPILIMITGEGTRRDGNGLRDTMHEDEIHNRNTFWRERHGIADTGWILRDAPRWIDQKSVIPVKPIAPVCKRIRYGIKRKTHGTGLGLQYLRECGLKIPRLTARHFRPVHRKRIQLCRKYRSGGICHRYIPNPPIADGERHNVHVRGWPVRRATPNDKQQKA